MKGRFTRVVTRGRTFIAEVDGLRFIAITAVVLYHLRDFTLYHTPASGQSGAVGSALSNVVSVGHYGVQLFFILSGFLLAMPFAKWRTGSGPKPSLRKYYLRRLTRLEPPYVAALILVFFAGIVAHALSGASKWPGLPQWHNLLASLVYQHNIVYGKTSLITPVVWSLEIEVQFYLLAPLLAVPFSLRSAILRRTIFATFVIALPLLRGLIPPDFGHRFNSLPWHLEYFVAGFLLADFFLVDWKEKPIRSLSWDVASIVGWPVLIGPMVSDKFSMLVAPAALLCYFGAFRGQVSSWILSRPLLTMIGGMCYSIYLLHYTVLMALGSVTKRLAGNLNFLTRFAIEALIAVPLIMLVAISFYAYLERPCMDPTWLSRLAGRLNRKGAGVQRSAEPVQAEGA